MKQTILPECLNHRFVEIPLDELPDKDCHDIEIVTLYEYNPTCLCEFTEYKKMHKYTLISEISSVTDYLANYNHTIKFYFDDYQVVMRSWQSLNRRRIFFILKNPYYEFKKLIADYISKERYAFMCKLNDGVFLMFVLDTAGNVFYTSQSMINLNDIILDFNNDFYSSPDKLFWTKNEQWHDNVRILSYFSELNIVSLSKEEFTARIMCSKLEV